MARAPTPDIATLLAHEPFVRALAQRLVGAGDEAEDVAQETLVRAIEHPPEPRLGLAGWLTTVARNVVRQRRRGDRRRVRREAVAARHDAVPSTETILEREVARRTVVEAVLELEEPYRTVVVLRWLEGLPPREVAARLSIPVETVRTRSRRAIEQLRERLDRRHGGRRATWLAALVPLAGTPPSATVARPRTLPLPALTAAAVGAAAVLVVVAAPGRVDDPGPATAAMARSNEGGQVETGSPRSWIPPEPKDRSATLAAGPATGPGIVRGFVLEPGRRPAAGARVRVRRAADATSRGEIRATVTDAQGRFAVEQVPMGPWIVEADSATGAHASTLVRAGRDPAWASLWLAPTAPVEGSLWVRVLGTDGRTVEGAEVEVVPVEGGDVVASRSAANGYALVNVPLSPTARRVLVEVRAAGFLVRRSIAWPARGEDGGDALALDVRLEAAGGFEGRVEAPAGIPLDGSSLVLWPASLDIGTATTLPRVRETAVAADGRFEMDGLAPGPYVIAVRAPSGLRIAEPAGSRVEITPGRQTAVALAVVAGATLRGMVTRSDTGAPIVGARVEWSTGVEAPPDAAAAARLDPRAPAEVDLGVRTDRRIVVTDADGRYEARGLAAGSAWRARVHAREEDCAVEVLEDVRLADGETREVAHAVRAAGTLVTVLEPGTAFGLRPVGGTLLVHGLAPRDGTTAGEDRVTGLAPGEWDLLAFPSQPGVPFAVARFEVVAGGTARVDGPAASDVVMRGRVTQAGQPAEGAWVSALGLGSRPTGADGRYEFEGPVGVPMLADVTFRAPGPDGVELRGQLTCMALGNRVLERDLALPAGSIEAHVLDAEGRPVKGALAHLRPRGEDDGWIVLSPVGTQRTTDGGGRARWTGVPPGAWTVRVDVPSSGARIEAPVDLGDQDRAVALEVREPATGRLKVVVLDDAGRPLPGARVRAIGSTDALYPFSAPTGADGSTVVAGLPAGNVRLVAALVDAGAEAAALASRPADAEVVAGEERTVILTWHRPRAGAGDGGTR